MKKTSNRFHVITVASDLFMAQGLANTTMDDVVLASSVSKSNIYYHFKSKEELIVAVLEYRIQELRDSVENIINTQLPASLRIEQIYRMFAEKIEQRACIGGCPIISLMSVPINEVKILSQHFFEDFLLSIDKLILEGIQSGEFKRSVNVAQSSKLILSTLEGAIMLAQINGDIKTWMKGGETIVHLLKDR